MILVTMLLLSGCDEETSTEDTTAVEEGPYGPDNRWPHAEASDVPSGLAGTGFAPGDVAHNFSMLDQFGELVELYQFYGRVIVLDVVAEWCGTCQEMAPEGQAVWEDLGDAGLMYITVMMEDVASGPPGDDVMVRWAEDHGLSHPVVSDLSGEQSGYVTYGYPAVVVIDRDMSIITDELLPFDAGFLALAVGSR
ncbi:MAG: thiol-disulfide isomerase/thioredoxin [Myxococcota bacterium]|jgi:thiol-disulfide isomerase/thioredoxin